MEEEVSVVGDVDEPSLSPSPRVKIQVHNVHRVYGEQGSLNPFSL